MMTPKIAVIGRGNVGSALQRGIERAGYPLKAAGHDAQEVRETVAWGDCIALAVPYTALDDVLRQIGPTLGGKVLIDATNVLTSSFELALGFTTSGAEELQKKASGAKVVKAFNTVFAEHMDTGQVQGTPLTLLVAGDDASAKETVMTLGRKIGFDSVDAGPLKNARLLEPLGYLNIQLGFMMKMGKGIGFTLIH
jgi:predicted dinucleotide-binding enzyme